MGAHRLAWWIAADDARVLRLCGRAGIGPATIDRLLTGEVVPDGATVFAIAQTTEGAVLAEDWNELTTLGWYDAPGARRPD